jgi:hypothetical protein
LFDAFAEPCQRIIAYGSHPTNPGILQSLMKVLDVFGFSLDRVVSHLGTGWLGHQVSPVFQQTLSL